MILVLLILSLCAPALSATPSPVTGVLATAPSACTESTTVCQSDSLLQNLFTRGLNGHLDEAVVLYLNVLESMDRVHAPEDIAILNRHLAQLALILPKAIRDRVMRADAGRDELIFRPEMKSVILAWWRSQDVLPATRANERMQEHLERVAYAEQHYRYDGRMTRLDDRGEVYVRLGKPSVQKPIKFTDSELIDELYRPGVALSPSEFPDSEVWQYGHVDRSTYYIFVRRNGFYQISDTEALIPATLRTGLAATTRGMYKSAMLIALLRSIFRQLQPIHPDFDIRYAAVDAYAAQLEELAMLAIFDNGDLQSRGVDASSNAADLRAGALLMQQRSGTGGPQPHIFSQSMLFQSKTEDQTSYGIRERHTPSQYSEVLRETEKLDLSYRTLRFLEDDGTTRTEIFWSPEPGALSPSRRQRQLAGDARGDFVVRLTAVQQRPDFTDRIVNRNHYLIQGVDADADAIPVQNMTIRGDSGLYHVAMQWDQYLAMPGDDDETVRMGPVLKIATRRADSLRALSADPGVLEMSDIKPILLGTAPSVYDVATARAAPAYPFDRLGAGRNLAIYFELYHLAFGADDLTHYEIDYTITRKRDGVRLFPKRGDRNRTSTKTIASGTTMTARELIVLDLAEYDEKGLLGLTLTVTDRTTGRRVNRTLQFEIY